MKSNIVASNHFTTDNPWGGFQFRFAAGDPIGKKYNANNLKNGDGSTVVHDELAKAKDFDAELFTVIRTMYNYFGVNHADSCGFPDGFSKFKHAGTDSWVLKYTPDNLEVAFEIELNLQNKVYHMVDAVQVGFELLNENNTGWSNGQTEGPHNSIENMLAYYNMMRNVWGKKVMLCIGGSYGDISKGEQPQWTRLIIEEIAKLQYLIGSWYHDSYGHEHYETLYHFFFEILAKYGIAEPFIAWLEVTGGANQWLNRTDVYKSPAQLFSEFITNMYSFLHNMGAWPNYNGTAKFVQDGLLYLPDQVKRYRAWIDDKDDPGPVEPPSDFVTLTQYEQDMKTINDSLEVLASNVGVTKTKQKELREYLRNTPE